MKDVLWFILLKAVICFAGEGIKVVASIHNKSSGPIQPKYYLYSKYSYFAKKKRKVEIKKILKEVGEAIPPSAGQTVTRTITIPPTTGPSILNCSIIMAEYRLKVRLSLLKTCHNGQFNKSADCVPATGLSGCQVCFRPWDQVTHCHPACFPGVWRGEFSPWIWWLQKLWHGRRD